MISYNFLLLKKSENFATFVVFVFVSALVGKRSGKMMFFVLLLNLFYPSAFSITPDNKTIANYNPNELLLKIFNLNDSIPRSSYGLVDFNDGNSNSAISNEEAYNNYHKGAIKFGDDFNDNSESNNVKFQDNINGGIRKKRRKKKRQNYGLQQTNGPYYGFGGSNPAFEGQRYRPRPRPPVSNALTAVTDALTSIAQNDDSQCVARLLCEAAGDRLGSGLLQTVSGLQPLLTLLSAYNGISTNPLFVFGRAVFLGMSANGNTASCRYAYPLCPTDPEQLLYYLNNHNGGFFRFFNAPHLDQQNVQQFYEHLSQNYGLHQNQNQNQQTYGLYNQQNAIHPNLYSNQQNYGLAYPYGNNNVRFKTNERDVNVQRRIQNRPNNVYAEDFSKWTFPNADNSGNDVNDDVINDYYDSNENVYNKRETLKFPDNNYNNNNYFEKQNNRNTRGFSFPEKQNRLSYSRRPIANNYGYDNSRPNFASNYLLNRYNSNNNVNYFNNNGFNNDVRTVYVVRGNGDPNHPEVIRLRPGETVQ